MMMIDDSDNRRMDYYPHRKWMRNKHLQWRNFENTLEIPRVSPMDCTMTATYYLQPEIKAWHHYQLQYDVKIKEVNNLSWWISNYTEYHQQNLLMLLIYLKNMFCFIRIRSNFPLFRGHVSSYEKSPMLLILSLRLTNIDKYVDENKWK